MNVVCLYADEYGCGNFRIIQPYKTIQSDINFLVCKEWGQSGITDTDQLSGVLFQRPTNEDILTFIKTLKSEGKIVVCETDDDLSNVPHHNYFHSVIKEGYGKIYEECLREATYVHVSTPQLVKSSKYIVFPNAVDLKKYTGRAELRKSFCEKHNINPDNKIVQWSGSSSHSDSLELIKGVVEELTKDKNITVVLSSNKTWLQSLGFKEKENLILPAWTPFADAYKVPAIADICLAPLTDNVFNTKKSELRLIEAGAWRVPSVASPTVPYQRFEKVSNGGCIIIRKERQKYWVETVYELIENEYLYDSIAEKSYICVLENYNLEIVNKNRAAWWMKVLAKKD